MIMTDKDFDITLELLFKYRILEVCLNENPEVPIHVAFKVANIQWERCKEEHLNEKR